VNDLEPSFVEDAHLVGLLKTFQNSVHIDSSQFICIPIRNEFDVCTRRNHRVGCDETGSKMPRMI
jgi:hypothetical protein